VHGLQAANVLGLVVVGAVVLALGVFRFTRKDIAT
jgi:ABC-type transport system involved in multi-copper enzyme maturation permease subunit